MYQVCMNITCSRVHDQSSMSSCKVANPLLVVSLNRKTDALFPLFPFAPVNLVL